MSDDGLLRPEHSPQLLAPRPTRGFGARRLNRRPAIIAGVVAAVVATAIMYTYHQRIEQAQREAAEAKDSHNPTPADGSAILGQAPREGMHKAAFSEGKPQTKPSAQSSQQQPSGPAQEDEAEKARRAAWAQYYQQVAEVDRWKWDAQKRALGADTKVEMPQASGTAPQGQQVSYGTGAGAPYVPGPSVGVPPAMPAIAGYDGLFGGYGGLPSGPILPDTTGANQKVAWMEHQADITGAQDTLLTTVRPPISPFLITAGDFINCVAVNGENSEGLGLFVGRVTRDIYDSATGQYRLIPQGSKVIGTYDTSVSAGQERIPTKLTRIIFPDSESLDLGGMPAGDASGIAGLHDQVNTHWWAKFGNALILGIAGAGAQLSQPQSVVGQGYSPTSVASASIAQQMAQVGAMAAQAGLSIPNTLEIRPGYSFTIQLTKDIVFPHPYVDMRTQAVPISAGPVMH